MKPAKTLVWCAWNRRKRFVWCAWNGRKAPCACCCEGETGAHGTCEPGLFGVETTAKPVLFGVNTAAKNVSLVCIQPATTVCACRCKGEMFGAHRTGLKHTPYFSPARTLSGGTGYQGCASAAEGQGRYRYVTGFHAVETLMALRTFRYGRNNFSRESCLFCGRFVHENRRPHSQ